MLLFQRRHVKYLSDLKELNCYRSQSSWAFEVQNLNSTHTSFHGTSLLTLMAISIRRWPKQSAHHYKYTALLGAKKHVGFDRMELV